MNSALIWGYALRKVTLTHALWILARPQFAYTGSFDIDTPVFYLEKLAEVTVAAEIAGPR